MGTFAFEFAKPSKADLSDRANPLSWGNSIAVAVCLQTIVGDEVNRSLKSSQIPFVKRFAEFGRSLTAKMSREQSRVIFWTS
jgi:hypothetical protein